MRNLISYTALGVALAGGVSVAQAQTVDTVIAPQPIVTTAPVVTAPAAAPVETVETVRTVQSTTRPAHRVARAHDRVTTTRTTISERVVPAPVAPVAAIPDYPRLYDVVTPAPAVAPLAAPLVPAAAPVGTVGATTVVPSYRYVYEPDRILVIDPYTNLAVQAIPR